MKGLFYAFVFLFFSLIASAQIEPKEPIRFLALGDSYTIGESVSAKERWPMQLADSLRERGFQVADPHLIAKTGWRTDQLINAIQSVNLPDTFTLVSLLIGVNNQYQGRPINQYLVEFDSLLRMAIQKANNDTERVFVVSIPDYAYTPFGQNQNPGKISAELALYNHINDSISNHYSVTRINITPISVKGLSEPSLVAGDGLHPSGEQYRLWVSEMMNYFPISTSVENNLSRNQKWEFHLATHSLRWKGNHSTTDQLQLLTLEGKVVWQKTVTASTHENVSLPQLPSGTYLLTSQSAGNQKLVIP